MKVHACSSTSAHTWYNTGLTDPMVGINGQIKLTMRVGILTFVRSCTVLNFGLLLTAGLLPAVYVE